MREPKQVGHLSFSQITLPILRVCPEICSLNRVLCNSAHHDADHGDLDEGEVGSDAVFDVFGEASAAVEPTEGAFDDPALRQDDEALGSVRSFDDLQRCAGGLADGACRVGALIGAVGDDALQEREQPADLLQYGQAAVPVLDVGRKDGHPQHQAERIHDRMALAPLDLLAGIVTDRIRGFAPLSALLTLWLSTIAVVGLASLPACSRART